MKNQIESIEISVVVPVYNIEPYIAKCINSIVCQTYEPYEIILVDDGSKDSSGKICDEYSEKFSNIHVIHKRNEGLSVARNTGFENAKGEYILFIDGDDWIDERLIESYITLLNKYGKCDYIHWRMTEVSVDGSKEIDDVYVKNSDAIGRTGREIFSDYINSGKQLRLGVKGLYRAQFLKIHNLYNKPGLYSEDQEFTPRVFYYADTVLSNEFPGYYYRKNRPGSLMNSLNLKKGKMLIGIYKEWSDIISLNNQKGKDKDFFKALSQELGIRFLREYTEFSYILPDNDINEWTKIINENRRLFNFYRIEKNNPGKSIVKKFFILFIKIFGVQNTTLIIRKVKRK